MRTRDFHFIVVSESSEHFVGQVENLLTCVNRELDRPVCELKWPSELEGLATLVIGRRRLVDMKMMETCRFQQICVKYGQPLRAPPAQEGLHGCVVAPSAYLESLLVVDPEWPGWRLEKTRHQLGVVQLAKRLGVWATAGSDNPDDLLCQIIVDGDDLFDIGGDGSGDDDVGNTGDGGRTKNIDEDFFDDDGSDDGDGSSSDDGGDSNSNGGGDSGSSDGGSVR